MDRTNVVFTGSVASDVMFWWYRCDEHRPYGRCDAGPRKNQRVSARISMQVQCASPYRDRTRSQCGRRNMRVCHGSKLEK